jgi:hypothetical protein
MQEDEPEALQELQPGTLVDITGRPSPPTLDQHFFPNFNGESSRFFGSSSVVILTAHVIRFAISNNVVAEADAITPPVIPATPHPMEMGLHKLSNEPPQNIHAYAAAFVNAFGALHGVIDGNTLEQQDIPMYLTLRSLSAKPEELHGTHMYQYFCVSMICAIGCATNARHQPDLAVKSLAFFEEVLPCVEEVTSEVSPQSLQALLLLAIFSLFWPTKGDVWKLLGYCCRLSVELGYHAEPCDELESEGQQNLRRSTFWGLYALEGLVSQIFGRSPDLHNAIITTKYPYATTRADGFGAAVPQYSPVSPYYRLMHIRFEIFKHLYLPAEVPNQSLDWYRDHFQTLQEWRAEFNAAAATETLKAICEVHYHSTICFLFQPLMLEAMASTARSPLSDLSPPAIPQDNYVAACELIRTYEYILRARRDSPLGSYPMTFVSAHLIYLACMTLMSHALLALIGHEKTWKMDEMMEVYETERIDLSELWSMSNSALVLLSWCSERWPGTQGMLNVFKKLVDKTIPAVFRRALF